MNNITIKGILADKCLKNMSEEEKDILLEQAQETKPSRIKTKFLNKKKKSKKPKFDDEE